MGRGGLGRKLESTAGMKADAMCSGVFGAPEFDPTPEITLLDEQHVDQLVLINAGEIRRDASSSF